MKVIALSLVLLGPFWLGTPPGHGEARLHTVRLSTNSQGDQYRFSPSRIMVAGGDSIVFRVESGGPHALGIEASGVPRPVLLAWDAALPSRKGFLRGPLLQAEDSYLVVVPRGIPAGRYRFYCLSHRAYDMQLEVVVR